MQSCSAGVWAALAARWGVFIDSLLGASSEHPRAGYDWPRNLDAHVVYRYDRNHDTKPSKLKSGLKKALPCPGGV